VEGARPGAGAVYGPTG